MFNVVESFKKQFTRVEGGYLVYPSRKLGGKLVSDKEYEHLVRGWERVAGRSSRWTATGIIAAIIILWTLLSDILSLPEWVDSLLIASLVVALSASLLWASAAPSRLVKDRSPVTPPRMVVDARRDARAALSWPFVAFALVFSGAAFLGGVTAAERSFGAWAWIIGSGAMLGLYIWIGFRKLTDRAP
jgi:hypothetical protein